MYTYLSSAAPDVFFAVLSSDSLSLDTPVEEELPLLSSPLLSSLCCFSLSLPDSLSGKKKITLTILRFFW